MEVFAISNTISSIAYSTGSVRFVGCFMNPSSCVLSLTEALLDLPQQSRLFHVSSASPPPTRTIKKRTTRRIRRAKRKVLFDDGDDNGFFVFGDGWEFDSGGYSGGGGGGGGKGWNFGGQGGSNWEDSGENSISDPAFDFVYEVLCWIAMSNCLHFAFKKVVRLLSDQFGDREKGSMHISPVC